MTVTNKTVKEKLATLLNARNNAVNPMTFMSSEVDVGSGATIGGLASNYSDNLNIYAIQTYIDKATGTVTRASNIFGDIDVSKLTTQTGVQLTPTDCSPSDPDGYVCYDQTLNTIAVGTDKGYHKRMCTDSIVTLVNVTGSTITKNTIVEFRGGQPGLDFATCRIADASRYEENWVVGVAMHDSVSGTPLEAMLVGAIDGIDTSMWSQDDPLYLSNTPGVLTNVRPTWPAEAIFIGAVTRAAAVDGRIVVKAVKETFDYIKEGLVLERQSVDIVSDGITVWCEVGNADSPAINLPIQVGNKIYRLNTTTGPGTGGKARVVLTQGTATSTQLNYVVARISGSDVVLSAETTRPTGTFAYIDSNAIQDAVTVQTIGALKHRRHTDAIFHDGRGRISYIDERLRALGAQFDSGMDSSIQINTAPAPDTITGTVAAGIAYQVHLQNTPAYSIATDGVYVANASGLGTLTKYQKIYNLGLCLEDANGNSLSGQNFNLVLFQVVNTTTGECKLFVNLPTKGYATDSNAYYDSDSTAVVSAEYNLRDCAVLLCRIPVSHKATSGGQFFFLGSVIGGLPDIIDLRGNPIGTSGSGAGGFTSVFQDSAFRVVNTADNTKQVAFDSSGITTATTRTFTLPDVNDTLVTRNTIIPPTSSVGLPSGAIWNNAGTLAIVP